jgi:uncharacterized protein YjbJ (UPF0337 family)
MNWDRLEGRWKQERGKAVAHWGRIMSDELAAIAGKYDERVGRLQEEYGIALEVAIRQREELRKTAAQLKESNRELIKLQKALNKKIPGSRLARPKKPQGIRRRIRRGE